jgi:hypothetical protein
MQFKPFRLNAQGGGRLERRNKIAHGEYLDLTHDNYRELADEILILLRLFKTDIENAAVLSKYLQQTSN